MIVQLNVLYSSVAAWTLNCSKAEYRSAWSKLTSSMSGLALWLWRRFMHKVHVHFILCHKFFGLLSRFSWHTQRRRNFAFVVVTRESASSLYVQYNLLAVIKSARKPPIFKADTAPVPVMCWLEKLATSLTSTVAELDTIYYVALRSCGDVTNLVARHR